MKVILTKDIRALGEAGQLVKVKPGHARNYLLPKGFAIPANSKNIEKIEQIKKQASEEKIALHSKYAEVIKKIEEVELTFVRKADENNHLYGSVSENDIVKALADKDIEIHKADVVMDKHIKEIGSTDVIIRFLADLQTTVKVNIDVENIDIKKVVQDIQVEHDDEVLLEEKTEEDKIEEDKAVEEE